MMPSSHKEARAIGAVWYFTGKPCKRGHVAPRFASCGRCKVCHRQQKANYRRTEKHRAWKRSYDKKYSEIGMTRKKLIKQATPLWADVTTIKKFYRNCPKGMHVDHILPLVGKSVCGLHVIENLQYLDPASNLSKWTYVPENISDFAFCEIYI